jgi:hypothetical protein
MEPGINTIPAKPSLTVFSSDKFIFVSRSYKTYSLFIVVKEQKLYLK